MKRLAIIFLASIISTGLWSQAPCSSFNCTIERAQKYISSKDYTQAFEYLQSAEGYPDPSGKNKLKISSLRKKLFNSIDKDRLKAEEDRRMALRNEEIARREKERADSLANISTSEKQKALEALELAKKMTENANIAERKKNESEKNKRDIIDVELLQELGTQAKNRRDFEKASHYFNKSLDRINTLSFDSTMNYENRKQFLLNEISFSDSLFRIKEKFFGYINKGDSLSGEGVLKYLDAFNIFFEARKLNYDNEKLDQRLLKLNSVLGEKFKPKKEFKNQYFPLLSASARANILTGQKKIGYKKIYNALEMKPNKKYYREYFQQYPEFKLPIQNYKSNFSNKLGFTLGTKLYFPDEPSVVKELGYIISPDYIPKFLTFVNAGVSVETNTFNKVVLRYGYTEFLLFDYLEPSRVVVKDFEILNKYSFYRMFNKKNAEILNFQLIAGIKAYYSKSFLQNVISSNGLGVGYSIENLLPFEKLILNPYNRLEIGESELSTIEFYPDSKLNSSGVYEIDTLGFYSCKGVIYTNDPNNKNSILLTIGLGTEFKIFPSIGINIFTEINYNYLFLQKKDINIDLGQELRKELISLHEFNEAETEIINNYYSDHCNITIRAQTNNHESSILSGLNVVLGVGYDF